MSNDNLEDSSGQPEAINEQPALPVVNNEPVGDVAPSPRKGFWKKKYSIFLISAIGVFILALCAIWGYNFWQSKNLRPKWQEQPVGLIAGKVSQSAPLAINLPDSVTLTPKQAESAITFEPKILGTWTAGRTAKELIFKPNEKLYLGKYFHISLTAENFHLEKDFQADEDPKVQAIFPIDKSEAPENTEITIEFNRPMVPLSSLDEQDKTKIPVVISPLTDGKFKWATTRTLKFMPASHLQRSSNYAVKVESGFVSMDGLGVAPFESSFTTRPLRYSGDAIHHPGTTLYDEPVAIRFNESVNLEKTKNLVEVKNSDGNNVSFVAEYGSRSAVLSGSDKASDYTDKSVVFIYQNKDKFGREKFWDSKASYDVTIKGAVPLEGDINLDETRSVSVQIPDVVAQVTANSPRSNLVEPGLFDPKGHLVIDFYEDIDKAATKINAPGLKGFEYAKSCKLDADGNQVFIGDGSECEKEDNKKELVLSFDENAFKAGQQFNVELAKIVNVKGLQLNAESIKESVNVYPEFKILATFPKGGEAAASVTDLVICSNSPIQDAELENFDQMLKSNPSVGKWYWHPAYKVEQGNPSELCGIGQFDTFIQYGLRPQAAYKINLHLSDQFGQTLDKDLNFTSGKIDSTKTDFASLQKGYNVTSPNQTKLTFTATNLDYVDLQVCQISATTMLEYMDADTQPAETLPGSSLKCQTTWQKRITLPPKYWTLNYFQVELKDIVPDPLGYYVLSFSNPLLRQQSYNSQTNQTEPGPQIYNRTLLNVTRLAAQEKKVEVDAGQEAERSVERKVIDASAGNLYWITEIGSLNPVEGASVQVYQKNKKVYSVSDIATSGASGIARAKPYTGDGAAIVSKNGDSTIVSSQNDKFQWASSYRGGDKTYIYSDRPIYRPGQQVFIKGLYRIGYDGNYEVYQGKQAHLIVFNSSNDPVLTEDLDVNPQGTFSTVFNLPADAPLGSYRVEALGGYYSFDVEDYVPAAFKLDLSSDKDEYIAGDTFKVNVDANYYFGVPVEGGQVEYSVLAQDYYFDRYQSQQFEFGAGWYYSPYPEYGDSYILRNKMDLGSDGKATISQALDFGKFFNADNGKNSKIFVVRVTVKNTTGQSISGEKSFIVHRGEFYLGANLDKPYFGKGEANKINIKTVDTNGKEKAVSGITGKISKVTWDYNKRQEVDGNYYYSSEQKFVEVQKFDASTDSQGNFSKDFTVKDEGEYQAELTSKDSRGNQIVAVKSFYVYGDGTVDVRPLNNESLDLAVENSQLEVGQKTHIIIKSPYPKAKALVSIERGRILDYEIIDVNSNFYDYVLNVKLEYLPNFYVTVLLISPKPEVRFGQSQFYVDTKEKTISVESKANKNNYLPGEEVVLDVTTKDQNGKAVSADVSLAVADLSVLALAGNPKKNPVSFFYDGRPLSVTTASNLKNFLQEAEIPAGTKGGGGADPTDLAAKKRGVFKDTAYGSADVITDANGHAQVKFTLPDNLTTWQVESLGLTTDTKLGVGYSEFSSKKDLMVVPLHPRFVIPGDEFVIGGKIFNQTGSKQSLNVNFQSGTLESLDKKDTSITLDSGQTTTVYFKVKSPEGLQTGDHKFTITAKNDKFTDSVENTFPIKPDQTYEAVATANYSTDLSSSEFVWLPKNILPNKGNLQIQASASMAGVVPDALNYLVAYPYGCTEQMMSKLSAVATLKQLKAVNNLGDKFIMPAVDFDGQKYSADDVVSIGLARVMANQTSEGGFSYYPNMKADYYLTLDVLNALEDLRAAGYKIDDSAENLAVQYVFQTYSANNYLSNSNDTTILTEYTFSRITGAGAQFSSLASKISNLLAQPKFINEDISNLSLAYLALIYKDSNKNGKEADKIFNVLENRVVIDGRGAYLGVGNSGAFWQYYETPIKDTALLIKALSNAKRDYAEMPKLLRFIKNSRSKDGAWGSTNNTVTVLDAIADYLKFKPETDSDFSLNILLDGQSKMTQTFGGKTVLDTLDLNLPMSQFTAEKLSEIKFTKNNLNSSLNGYYYDMSLRYFLPIDQLAPRDEGFAVEREMYALSDKKGVSPLSSAKVGDVIRGHLKITVTKPRNFVNVESFIPAGTELVNFNLATENPNVAIQTQDGQPALGIQTPPPSINDKPVVLEKPGFWKRIWMWILGLFRHKNTSSPSVNTVADLPDEVYSNTITQTNTLYPDSTEMQDDRLMLFNQSLQPGVYEYDYFVRALIPGRFQHQPAVASELYQPENFGRSRGELFEIKQ